MENNVIAFLSEVKPGGYRPSVPQLDVPLESSAFGKMLTSAAAPAIRWLRDPHAITAVFAKLLSGVVPPPVVNAALSLITSESQGNPSVVNKEKAGNTASGFLQLTAATASSALSQIGSLPAPLRAVLPSYRDLYSAAVHFYGPEKAARLKQDLESKGRSLNQLWPLLVKDFPESQLSPALAAVYSWYTRLQQCFVWDGTAWKPNERAINSVASDWLKAHPAIARSKEAGLQALATLYWIGSATYLDRLTKDARDKVVRTVSEFENAGRFNKDIGHMLTISVQYPRLPVYWHTKATTGTISDTLRKLTQPATK